VTPLQILVVVGYALYLLLDWRWTRSVGGNLRANVAGLGINLAAFAIAVLVPFPIGWLAGVAIAAGAVSLREHWIDAVRGRRPASGLFAAYRRLYRSAEKEWSLPPGSERENAHAESVDALARLDRWRSPDTDRLIALLHAAYDGHDRDDFSTRPELDSEMVRLWGEPSTK
jgi:hypothetical protein